MEINGCIKKQEKDISRINEEKISEPCKNLLNDLLKIKVRNESTKKESEEVKFNKSSLNIPKPKNKTKKRKKKKKRNKPKGYIPEKNDRDIEELKAEPLVLMQLYQEDSKDNYNIKLKKKKKKNKKKPFPFNGKANLNTNINNNVIRKNNSEKNIIAYTNEINKKIINSNNNGLMDMRIKLSVTPPNRIHKPEYERMPVVKEIKLKSLIKNNPLPKEFDIIKDINLKSENETLKENVVIFSLTRKKEGVINGLAHPRKYLNKVDAKGK